MGRLEDILVKNKMTEKGVEGIKTLFSHNNVEFLNKLTNFSEEDIEGIKRIKDCMEQKAIEIASEFYDYLMAIDECRVIVTRREDLLEQLKLTQAHYIKQLFSLKYDEKYFANRLVVGFAHYISNISLTIYIGSYGYYNTLISRSAMECCKDSAINPAETLKIINSLQKLLSTDITLATEAYYKKSIDDFYRMEQGSLSRLIVLAEYRDKDTGNHIARMAHYAAIIAEKLGLDYVCREDILNAAPMHDIGKVGIADKILLKSGKLTEEEFEVMKTHCEIGHNLLKDSDSSLLRKGALIALNHHENFDGSGYPNGLKGEEIHLYGRITKIADVFDALINKRVYKESYDIEKALYIMRNEMRPGVAFDPACFDAFMKGIDEILAARMKIDGGQKP